MLSFRVSLALRAKPLRHKLNFARPQTFRTTPTCNLNRINQLHALENHAYATHLKSITSTLFEKQPGVYPPTPPPEFFSGSSAIFSASQRPKQEMPQRIHQRMHNRRRKERLRLPPRPPIKHPGDRCQNQIPPIREPHVRNVREPKQNGSQPPAPSFILRRPLQHVLQQSAKQKLLRPRRETEYR